MSAKSREVAVAVTCLILVLSGAIESGSAPLPEGAHGRAPPGSSAGHDLANANSRDVRVTDLPVRLASLALLIAAGGSVGAIPLFVQFYAFPSGGTPPYNLSWVFGDGGSYSSTSTGNTTHNYTIAGIYYPTLWLNDSANGSVNESIRIVAEAQALVVTDPKASPSSADVGESVGFSVNTTGGSGVYNYTWNGLPAGCLSRNSSQISCYPSTPGLSSIYVLVFDSEGYLVVTNTTSFLTSARPSSATIYANPSDVDVGQSTSLSVSVMGGQPPWSFQWAGLPSGCLTLNLPALSCRPNVAGMSNVAATATDSNGISITGFLRVTVSPALTVGAMTSSRSWLEVGQSLTLNITDSGGAGARHYAWSGLPTGCGSADLPHVSCSPSGPGHFSPTVVVTDANGASNTSLSASVDVVAALTASLSISIATVAEGNSVFLNAIAKGGQTPYSYVYSGLPQGCTTANSSSDLCVPSAAGTFSLVVTVADSIGGSATGQAVLNVSSSRPATAITSLQIGAVSGAAIGAGIVVALHVRRSRQKRIGGSDPAR